MKTCSLFLFGISLWTNIIIVHSELQLVTSDKAVWTLRNKNGSIEVPATVPGGVYSDLQTAGVISNILSGFNDVLTRWVAYDEWTYTGKFNVTTDQLNADIVHLVFEGVDTVAYIELNDSPVGATDNMFVRYLFDVKENLKVGENKLKIDFASPVAVARVRSDKHFTAPACVPNDYHGECHANQIRKMQASFSWDWGPAFPSVGIWKPAAIEFYSGATIRSITTHTQKLDQYWKLKIIAHLESRPRKHISGFLSASLEVEGHQTLRVGRDLEISFRDDGTVEAELNLTISENVIRAWWPNGYGDQSLYDLNVYLSTKGNSDEVSHKQLQVGFRTLEIIEENATLTFGNSTAGKGLTFYFKINGYPIFMKGSNCIPAHILPERGDNKQTIDELLTAAKDTHMTMLRVWGGGIYESDYFYQRCDQLGLLIWQDFLFACSMYPVDADFLETVKIEIEQNVVRLQYHPSIAVWAGNNENEVALRGNWYDTNTSFKKYKQEYIKLYVDTIKPIVEMIDPGRRYLVSSPSNGLESEREGYVARNPYDANYGDTHYYNYFADNWDWNIYPKTRFASEYGFQSMPSLLTIRTATNRTEDFNIESEYCKHRQHSPNGNVYMQEQIMRHLRLDKNDSKYFEKFVFYSQITQAMAMKTETENYRRNQANWYTMGALYWQLNDVWQAPSWSGIEFGGKWKMLHYFAKSFFAPVLVSPQLLLPGEVEVYLINDRFVPIIDANITVDVFNWSSLTPIKTKSYSAFVGPLSARKQDIEIDLWDGYDKELIFLRFSLQADGVPSSPLNFVFPISLKSVKGLKEPRVQVSVSRRFKKESDDKIQYSVDIRVDTVVLFLWLDTDSVDGQFEDNGFVVTEPHLRVNYISKTNLTPSDLERAITYQYYLH